MFFISIFATRMVEVAHAPLHAQEVTEKWALSLHEENCALVWQLCFLDPDSDSRGPGSQGLRSYMF